MKQEFSDFFNKVTGGQVNYPYQKVFATADTIPHLLRAPTGAGKTATAILGWLYRWTTRPESIPRRLAYCLPMRVLVEQSEREAKRWIANLGLDIPVYVLMGGVETDDWYLRPEHPAILIGTQDMLLSRALNRGYATSRFHWPIDFALLNNDCLWVFDEPQLMGSGVSTSAQLAGLRKSLCVQFDCPSVWMSATLEPDWLDTIDFRGKFTDKPLELTDADYDPKLPLLKRMTAAKKLRRLDVSAADVKAIARALLERHQPGTQTLVIVNIVDRATNLYGELLKLRKKSPTPVLLLVHSRFRPEERNKLNELLQDKSPGDRIIIATQVVEAGVDISSRMLITELAPWASMIQRIGRCNRTGDDGNSDNPANVFWIDIPEKSAAPYDADDLKFAREQLAKLEDKNVSPKALDDFKRDEKITLSFEHKHVLRRRDLLDLFDTTPDLAGNDIDIDRFVRDTAERDVRIFWRKWDRRQRYAPPDDKHWRQVGREELCAAPLNDDFRTFANKHKGSIWQWSQLDGKWIRPELFLPGLLYLIHTDAGGYDPLRGWGPQYKTDFKILDPPELNQRDEDDFDDDGLSMTDDFERIDQHTDKVFECLESILEVLSVPEAHLLRIAARWHDFGKAHEKFQIKIDNGQELTEIDVDGNPMHRRTRPMEWAGCCVLAKAPGKRWDRAGELIDLGFWKIGGNTKDGFRKHFRHELASALAVLQRPHDDLRALTDTDLNLVAYLAAAHHGKVRLSIRSMPKELKPRTDTGVPLPETRYARGVWDGDEIPETDLGGKTIAPKVKLSLEPMELGLCEHEPFAGQPSWVERVIHLRDTFRPFRLAYLEALLRAADMRASAKLGKGTVNP
jgi:CRISPR-associated endonuclease/helicase Cas3